MKKTILVLLSLVLTSSLFAQKNAELNQVAIQFIHQSILDIPAPFQGSFTVVGNFPYNISSQIFFKVLSMRNRSPEVVGMVQKEVAEIGQSNKNLFVIRVTNKVELKSKIEAFSHSVMGSLFLTN